MTGLTAAQINSGVKRNVRAVKRPPDLVGRWICHLCPWPAWTAGTWTDWTGHYLAEHHEKED